MHRRIRTVLMAFALFGIAQMIWETVLPRFSGFGLAVISIQIAVILIFCHLARGGR